MPEALFTEIEQAQIPVQLGLPELEIDPSECSCCWDWWFKGADLGIGAWFGPSVLQEMWDLLWRLVDTQMKPGDSFLIDLTGDQSEGWAVFRALSAQEIEIGIKSLHAGPCQYLHFRCEREALISLLSEQMHRFVKHPLYLPDMDRLEQMDLMSIAATAPEWPWTLFPLWYTLNTRLSRSQIKWLIFTTLERAPEFSQLHVHKKDPIDDLLIQCYWNCFLYDHLPPATESESGYNKQLQAYTDECEQIFAFAITMDIKWRNGCFYAYEDRDKLTYYYDRHRDYLEHTSESYLARMRWWMSHLKYAARLAFPELYDWKEMQSWESHLCETEPDLYELLDLKWRPNTIWKASFGHDS